LCTGPPRENLAVLFSGTEDGVDSILRSDSASARVGGRPALDSLDALSSEVYWADLPNKERLKWMVDEELAVSSAPRITSSCRLLQNMRLCCGVRKLSTWSIYPCASLKMVDAIEGQYCIRH